MKSDPIRRRLEKLVEGTATAAKEAALMLAEYDACDREKQDDSLWMNWNPWKRKTA